MLKIALRFILFDKAKSIGALSGVVIAVFLIGQQSGIFLFLTDAMAALVRNNAGYIWVVDPKTTNVNAMAPIDLRLGKELESIPGVKKAYPILIAGGQARFSNGISSGVTLIGVQAPGFVGGPWNLKVGRPENLLQDGAVITDFFDRKTLGLANIGDYFEINGRKVFIAGQTRGVRAFGAPVYTFTTIERARALAKQNPYKASAFLVAWDRRQDSSLIIQRINSNLVGVRAWASKDFTSSTVSTVLRSSGIAISFGTLIVFALISGFVIIGLTLYSSTVDRIRDYGTLKAIGATNKFIRRLILTQAIVFALIGFAIGFGLVTAFRLGIAKAGTLFQFQPWMIFAFFLITLGIAAGGTLFAIRRIARLEPASVFRL